MNIENEFSEENYSDMADSINNYIRNLSILDFKDNIIELSDILPGEFYFSHGINKVPRYRIILKQVGGGLITDSELQSDNSIMRLVNNGSVNIKKLIIMVG